VTHSSFARPQVSDQMPGASGAEIKAVCTEAGMYALRERRVHVTQEDFEMAAVKVGLPTQTSLT
jgi:26S proteasome regulatory subunit T6